MKKIFYYLFIVFALFLTTCQATPVNVLPSPYTNPEADKLQDIIFGLEGERLNANQWERRDYYLAIEYTIREALTDFPDDPRADSWKWKFAYYSILAGDTKIGNKTFGELITNALNSDVVTIDSLPTWFQSVSKPEEFLDFELVVESILRAGQDKKYLININTFPGGSCFLLTKTPQAYSIDLIYDGFPDGGFAYVYDSLGCTLKDITNDGNDEVILEHYIGAHVGFSYLRVMDISVNPMRLLPFKSPIGENVFVKVHERVNNFPFQNGKNLLRTSDNAQNCQVSLEKTYIWSDNKFEPMEMQFRADLKYAPLKECLVWSITYARWVDVNFGIDIIEQAIAQYESVAVDEIEKEKLDEVRIEKALLYFLADRPEDMHLVMQDIINNPYQSNSIWVEPVNKFLHTYQNPSDIYKACSQLIACVSSDSNSCYYHAPCAQDAFKYLVNNEFKNILLNDLIENLENAGVEISSNGWIDLDYDGQDELWFVVVPPDKIEESTYELWIATDYPNRIEIFSIPARIQTQNPKFHIQFSPDESSFVKYNEDFAFIWSRDDVTNEPTFHFSVCSTFECYKSLIEENKNQFLSLREKFQSGADLYEMYVKFMNLKKKYEVDSENTCALCYFDFGYSAELVGDTKTAHDMYSKIIEKFPDNPLAVLASYKLNQ